MACRVKRLLWNAALDLVYPPHCEFCNKPILQGSLCKECLRRIRWIRFPYCHVCSLPVQAWITETFVCTSCRLRQFHFRFAVCACEAEDIVRQLIHRFKYRKIRRLERLLSWLLFRAWRDPRVITNPPEMLTPVPLHPLRQRERGFNQARILAEALSKRTGIPCKSLLKRPVLTQSQTLLSRCERKQNLRGAFAVHQNKFLNYTHVMLVDDVLTTGSTLEECSKTLLAAGVRTVSAITVARA